MSDHPRPLPPELDEALEARRDCLGALAGRIVYFETIGFATNDVASGLAQNGAHEGAVVIAMRRPPGAAVVAGLGSPPSAGLYVSVILAPRRARVSPERATASLTLTAGVDLLGGGGSGSPAWRWPSSGRTTCRRAAEARRHPRRGGGADRCGGPAGGRAGLRHQRDVGGLPAGTRRSIVTSLETELGRGIDRAALCAELLASLAARYDDLLEGATTPSFTHGGRGPSGARGARSSGTRRRACGTGLPKGFMNGRAAVWSAGSVERIQPGKCAGDSMLLAIDVGNTNIVLGGVFQGTELIRSWRLQTLRDRTADELGLAVDGLFAHVDLPDPHPRGRVGSETNWCRR